LRIKDVLDEIKTIADKHLKTFYEVKLWENQKNKYWVDIITGDLRLGELDSFSAELARQFNIDRSRLHVGAPKENEISTSLFLPYLKVLTPSEVGYKFIIVEEEFRDYFPPPDDKFFVVGDERVYEASLDEYSRIYLTKWFKDNPKVKPGDVAILQPLDPTCPLEAYVLTVRR